MYGGAYPNSYSSSANSYPSFPGGGMPPGPAVVAAASSQNAASSDDAEVLGLIQHLDKEELQKLLDSTDKMDSMITDSRQVKSIVAEKETLLSCNRSLAEFNLAMQPKLEAGKGQLVALHDAAKAERAAYDVNKAKLESFGQSTCLDTVLALLQTAAAQSEEKTEAMANDFVNGRLDATQFIEQYLPERQHAHTRRIKAEKMADLVNRAAVQQSQAAAPVAATLPATRWDGGVYGPQPVYGQPPHQPPNPVPGSYQAPFGYGGR